MAKLLCCDKCHADIPSDREYSSTMTILKTENGNYKIDATDYGLVMRKYRIDVLLCDKCRKKFNHKFGKLLIELLGDFVQEVASDEAATSPKEIRGIENED